MAMRWVLGLLVFAASCCVVHTATYREPNALLLAQLSNSAQGCPEQCRGRGACVSDASNTKSCVCNPGYSGPSCGTWSRCSSLNYCSGHGACNSQSNTTEQCTCNQGFHGPDCSVTISECFNNCSGFGSCRTFSSGDQMCVCDFGFAGEGCSKVANSTCPHNCGGRGTCTINGTCVCSEGHTGEDCTQVLNLCTRDCGQGFCRKGECECLPGYQGKSCNIYIPKKDKECAALNFCSGAGTCHTVKDDQGTRRKCTCFDGFGGADCSQVEIDLTNCPGYCNGHGSCQSKEGYQCVCHPGWTGAGCDISLCARDSNGNVCGNRGVCEVIESGSASCVCDPEWENGFQQTCEVSKCPNECSGFGVCSSNGTCRCDAEHKGLDCSEEKDHPSVEIIGPIATPHPIINSNSTQQQHDNQTWAAARKVALFEVPDAAGVTPPTRSAVVESTAAATIARRLGSKGPASSCSDCGVHGECVQGTCVCKDGYMGLSCNIPSTEPNAFDELD